LLQAADGQEALPFGINSLVAIGQSCDHIHFNLDFASYFAEAGFGLNSNDSAGLPFSVGLTTATQER
jgi:hypothetical protein